MARYSHAFVHQMAARVYTDGSCKKNPGVGGWGVRIEYSDGRPVREMCGGERSTTNNRQEAFAVIVALRETSNVEEVDIYTDSTYVQKGAQTWMKAWKAKGWRTARNEPVKNVDLWIEVDRLMSAARAEKRIVRLHWVRGHSGNPGNDAADALANRGVVGILSAAGRSPSTNPPMNDQ